MRSARHGPSPRALPGEAERRLPRTPTRVARTWGGTKFPKRATTETTMLRALLFAAAAALAAPALAADPGAEAASAYTLDTAASTGSVKVGDPGKLVLVIKPKAPTWHVHPQAPLKIRFEAPAALKLEKTDLGRKDVVDPKAVEPRFETAFVASAAGPQQARAVVDFFICSDAACVKQARTVVIPVDVK